MMRLRYLQLALLLALMALSFSLPGMRTTSYGGWPALGFATALLVVAGRAHRWLVLGLITVVSAVALPLGYGVALWLGIPGSLIITVPAVITALLLRRDDDEPDAPWGLQDVDLVPYHLVTAVSGLVCGVLAALTVVTFQDTRDVLLTGLMSVLAATSAQLVVLPLLMRTSDDRRRIAGPVELWVQRLVLAALTLSVFTFGSRVGVAFLLFPAMAWAALRASRLEAHVQLIAVSTVAYLLTFDDHGPLAISASGLPEELSPALLYLFIAALCYLVVPLACTVQRLARITDQATRSAGAVEQMLDAATGTIVIATDAAGGITHFNHGAEQALGWTLEEVRGRSPSMFHTPAEIARQAEHFGVPARHTSVALAQAASGEKRDWEFVAKDGSVRLTSLSLNEMTDPHHVVVGYIATAEDVTERVRAQQALVAALDREHAAVLRLQEVDHVKEDLISNVSHELRTPITSISGYTELLSGGDLGQLNPMQADAVRRIERNGTRLGILVEDLLTMARSQTGDLEISAEELDLRSTAADAHEMLQNIARSRPLDVRLVLPDEPVPVLGDPRALERVATNLLSNAIKFTPDGGTVTTEVARGAGGALLRVSDTGMGISADDQRRLFTRFFRTAAATQQAIQGTGLGLSIVHAIVTRHGGSVDIDSEPGRGTVVTVVLPARVRPSSGSSARRA